MNVKRRRLPNFETCSVALFATLALSGPFQARAQTSPPAARISHSAPAPSKGTMTPNASTRERLSRLDAFRGPKDGSLSSADFDETLK
jgi:hypothetical protein